jgi:hypothetical protein
MTISWSQHLAGAALSLKRTKTVSCAASLNKFWLEPKLVDFTGLGLCAQLDAICVD